MIFAGADVGLPCFVGRYVNFRRLPNRKNYITFGGTGATCSLEQYEVKAEGSDDDGSSYMRIFYNGYTGQGNSFISFGQSYRSHNYGTAFYAYPDYLRIGADFGYNKYSHLSFDADIAVYAFKTFFGQNSNNYTETKIQGYDSLFQHILHYNNSWAGTKITATDATVYCWAQNSQNVANFASMRGNYGRIEAGINTNYAGLRGTNSCYGLFGQLDGGNFGLFFTNWYNRLQWAVVPGVDWIEFYLQSNRNPVNRVGLYCSSRQASIEATSGAAGATRNLYWDVGGVGVFHLWSSGGNFIKFYSSEGSCYVSTTVANYLKWNMNIGLFQLWGNSKYIDLNLYMLEMGMNATFHYVYTCDPKTGRTDFYKVNGRNVKVLSTAPLIIQSCQAASGPGTNTDALCAIRYG